MIKTLSRLIIVSLFTLLYSCEEDENKLPVPDFTADKTIVATGESVNFTDLTKYNPKTWLWNFGDESNSTLQNPTHVYKFAGKYFVHLYTENENGANYIKKDDLINVYLAYENFTDNRDNKTYKTVKIGQQWWMAENLNYNMEGSFAFMNNEENAEIYGRLYYYKLAINACPIGWHLPSKAEWNELIEYVGPKPGKELKAVSDLWQQHFYNIIETNGTGFTALPGGGVVEVFTGINQFAHFWSSSLESNRYPMFIKLAYFDNLANLKYYINTDPNTEELMFSIRCIKD